MIENVVLSNLFTIPLLQVNISEDTSELSGNTDFIPSTKQENTYPPIGPVSYTHLTLPTIYSV